MIAMPINNLTIGAKFLFQFSNWSPVNLKRVRILYKSETYVIMYNYDSKEEYCIKLDSDDLFLRIKKACFYIDPNGTEHYESGE
jgi:hypothetical protein